MLIELLELLELLGLLEQGTVIIAGRIPRPQSTCKGRLPRRAWKMLRRPFDRGEVQVYCRMIAVQIRVMKAEYVGEEEPLISITCRETQSGYSHLNQT